MWVLGEYFASVPVPWITSVCWFLLGFHVFCSEFFRLVGIWAYGVAEVRVWRRDLLKPSVHGNRSSDCLKAHFDVMCHLGKTSYDFSCPAADWIPMNYLCQPSQAGQRSSGLGWLGLAGLAGGLVCSLTLLKLRRDERISINS